MSQGKRPPVGEPGLERKATRGRGTDVFFNDDELPAKRQESSTAQGQQSQIAQEHKGNIAEWQESKIAPQREGYIDKGHKRSFRLSRKTHLQFERVYTTFRLNLPDSSVTHDDVIAALIGLAESDVLADPYDGAVAQSLLQVLATKQDGRKAKGQQNKMAE